MKNFTIKVFIASLFCIFNGQSSDISFEDYSKQNTDKSFVGWIKDRFEKNFQKKSVPENYVKDILQSIISGKGVNFKETRPATKDELKILKSISYTLIGLANVNNISLDDLKGSKELDNSKHIQAFQKKITSIDNQKIAEAIKKAEEKNDTFYISKKDNKIKFFNKSDTDVGDKKGSTNVNSSNTQNSAYSDQQQKETKKNITTAKLSKEAWDFYEKKLLTEEFKNTLNDIYFVYEEEIKRTFMETKGAVNNNIFYYFNLLNLLSGENPNQVYVDPEIINVNIKNKDDDKAINDIKDALNTFKTFSDNNILKNYQISLKVLNVKNETGIIDDHLIIYHDSNKNTYVISPIKILDDDSLGLNFIKQNTVKSIVDHNQFIAPETFYMADTKMPAFLIINHIYSNGLKNQIEIKKIFDSLNIENKDVINEFVKKIYQSSINEFIENKILALN